MTTATVDASRMNELAQMATDGQPVVFPVPVKVDAIDEQEIWLNQGVKITERRLATALVAPAILNRLVHLDKTGLTEKALSIHRRILSDDIPSNREIAHFENSARLSEDEKMCLTLACLAAVDAALATIKTEMDWSHLATAVRCMNEALKLGPDSLFYGEQPTKSLATKRRLAELINQGEDARDMANRMGFSIPE